MMDKKDIRELELIEAKLEELLPSVSKHKIEELQRLIATHFIKRFGGKRWRPKYGSVSKCFRNTELEAFFKVVDNPKLGLLWRWQATLALRIGEACVVNIKDLNLETREVLIRTLKAKTLDTLIIPIPLFNETLEFIRSNQQAIQDAQGYLFFADKRKSRRAEPYLDEGYVRNRFREYCGKAGLDGAYGVSDEKAGRSLRRLHKFTTHSLRHYGITRFAKQTNGNLILTSRFARHLKPETTMVYIAKDKTELYNAIEQTALNDVIKLKERVI